jgi:hypothetical protein
VSGESWEPALKSHILTLAVLLRVLEYYEGIMILTTNRITSLDIAVQSRIHLAIQYQDLSKDQKCNIFESFLKQLEPDDISDYEDIMEYVREYGCEEDLNGRQSMFSWSSSPFPLSSRPQQSRAYALYFANIAFRGKTCFGSRKPPLHSLFLSF